MGQGSVSCSCGMFTCCCVGPRTPRLPHGSYVGLPHGSYVGPRAPRLPHGSYVVVLDPGLLGYPMEVLDPGLLGYPMEVMCWTQGS